MPLSHSKFVVLAQRVRRSVETKVGKTGCERPDRPIDVWRQKSTRIQPVVACESFLWARDASLVRQALEAVYPKAICPGRLPPGLIASDRSWRALRRQIPEHAVQNGEGDDRLCKHGQCRLKDLLWHFIASRGIDDADDGCQWNGVN